MSASDRLVSDYLDRLEAELAGLPRAGRREVLDEIEAHIHEALAELDPDDEAGVRNVLERIGEPAEIAEEARERFGVTRAKTTWREIGALIFLSVGGVIVPVVGWFVGVVLLWVSDAWDSREKLLGTLFPPFIGLVFALSSLFDGGYATHGALIVSVFFAALLVDAYLLWKLRMRTA